MRSWVECFLSEFVLDSFRPTLTILIFMFSNFIKFDTEASQSKERLCCHTHMCVIVCVTGL